MRLIFISSYIISIKGNLTKCCLEQVKQVLKSDNQIHLFRQPEVATKSGVKYAINLNAPRQLVTRRCRMDWTLIAEMLAIHLNRNYKSGRKVKTLLETDVTQAFCSRTLLFLRIISQDIFFRWYQKSKWRKKINSGI